MNCLYSKYFVPLPHFKIKIKNKLIEIKHQIASKHSADLLPDEVEQFRSEMLQL